MKKSNKWINYLIYIIVFIMIFRFSIYLFKNETIIAYLHSILITPNILFGIIALFMLVHFLRFIRIYILLIEDHISILKLLKIYVYTTLVNNILPFKLGEFYKIYEYGKITKLSKGLILTWIDRFFDSIIIIIIGLYLLAQGQVSIMLIILFIFILFSILFYTNFVSTYKYFNKVVLTKSKSKKGIIYLKILEETKKIYEISQELVLGRSIILLVLSGVTWFIEYLMIEFIFGFLNVSFNYAVFFDYINFSFYVQNKTMFLVVSTVNILLLILSCIVFKIINKRKESKNEKSIISL